MSPSDADPWGRGEQVDPSRHRDYFAFINRGDTRQVYAVDLDRDSPTSFFLREGGATEALRADTRRGRFKCPMPGCPEPIFRQVAAGMRRDHFRHKPGSGADHRDVPPAFLVKRLVAEMLLAERRAAQVDIPVTESITADVLVDVGVESGLAIFVLDSLVSVDDLASQKDAADACGWLSTWVLAAPSDLAIDPGGRARPESFRRLRAHRWIEAEERPLVWVNPFHQAVAVVDHRRDIDLSGRPDRPIPIRCKPLDVSLLDDLQLARIAAVPDGFPLPAPGSVWAT